MHPHDRLVTFLAGEHGRWRVLRSTSVVGAGLPDAKCLRIEAGDKTDSSAWCLRGIRSNERYTVRREQEDLVSRQASLNRPVATRGALIPIRKVAEWWALTQDERRQIFEETSWHVKIGLRYLPAIARRLYHCRDLSDTEPFDFLTWFEFAPEDNAAFDDLVGALRATEEWKYVDREVDLRLSRDAD